MHIGQTKANKTVSSAYLIRTSTYEGGGIISNVVNKPVRFNLSNPSDKDLYQFAQTIKFTPLVKKWLAAYRAGLLVIGGEPKPIPVYLVENTPLAQFDFDVKNTPSNNEFPDLNVDESEILDVSQFI